MRGASPTSRPTPGAASLQSILYYALGGGHGHALRGLALLSRLGRGTLVLPERLSGWARALGVSCLVPPEQGAAGFLAALEPPELLLVDVFPRGVVAELGELLDRAGAAWLVARLVRPGFYLHPPVRAALESRYEQVVWTEPAPPELRALRVGQIEIPPVLLAPPLLPRPQARERLGIAAPERLVLALGSGDLEKQRRLLRVMGKAAARLQARLAFVSQELPEGGPVRRLFPAASCLLAADALVAAGGYHAVHEAVASGVPAVLVPQRRLYDDQFARVAGLRVARDPEQVESALGEALARAPDPPRPMDAGVRALARLVEGRVQPGVLGREEIAARAGRGRPA